MSNIYKNSCESLIFMCFAAGVIVFVNGKFINYDGNILMNIILGGLMLLFSIICLAIAVINLDKKGDSNVNNK